MASSHGSVAGGQSSALVHGVTQLYAEQISPSAQTVPHAPQFFTPDLMFTHFFPHFAKPWWHLHFPPAHLSFFAQHFPWHFRCPLGQPPPRIASAMPAGATTAPSPSPTPTKRRSAVRREISPLASSRATASRSLPSIAATLSHHATGRKRSGMACARIAIVESGAYWPQPWTCEDGGSRRWGSAAGLKGLDVQPGERLEVAAVHDAFATDLLVRREPGELYALRHGMPIRGIQATPVEGWVERLDPKTLAVTASSPRLPGGAYWPGGIAAHANGDLHMVFGRWAHRLSAELDVLASYRLPVARPHNSFVVLDGGELVTKDCDAPAGREPSTVSVLDPHTLQPVVPPLRLPEPSIARLSCDGESVIAVGTTVVFRLRLDREAGRITIDESWRPSYGPASERSYGWDPVITAEHVFWMDNGRNRVDRTMVGSGEQSSPVRLWWARRDNADVRSVEISGLPYGTESNPPGWDPEGEVVVAYDAGNAVVRAWRLRGDELEPLWRRNGLAHAGHLILYSDTRELIVGDWRDVAALRRRFVRPLVRGATQVLGRSAIARRASLRAGNDQLAVLDLDTGAEKAGVSIPSPSQGFLFPAPGFGRDLYYQSLTTIARVEVV